jgi:RimJ/RimL family protein N-acetyltransferase
MELRRATYLDWEFIRKVRNAGKEGFFVSEDVSIDEHEKFMAMHGRDYYIGVEEGEDVGFIGVVNDDIRVGVCKKRRGRGLGSKLIKKYTDEFLQSGRQHYVEAVIKKDNIASITAFEHAGWVRVQFGDRIVMRPAINK